MNYRLDHDIYIAETKIKNNFLVNFKEYKPFSIYIEEINNGQDVKKDYYSHGDTGILYLSVTELSNANLGIIDLSQAKQLIIEEKDIKIKVEPNDLLVTRSGTPGIAWVATENFLDKWDIVIPSGYLQRIKLKSGVNPNFFAAYLNLKPIRMLTTAYACGKDQFNLSQDYIKKIPIVKLSNEKQKDFIDFIYTCNNYIHNIRSLQNSFENQIQTISLDLLYEKIIKNDIKIPKIIDITKKIHYELKKDENWELPKRRGI